jgi:hypothetical protein
LALPEGRSWMYNFFGDLLQLLIQDCCRQKGILNGRPHHGTKSLPDQSFWQVSLVNLITHIICNCLEGVCFRNNFVCFRNIFGIRNLVAPLLSDLSLWSHEESVHAYLKSMDMHASMLAII